MATGKKTTPDEGTEVRQPMAEPEGGWPPDEYTGQAGTFIRDPYTGKRFPETPAAGEPQQPEGA